MNATVRPDGVRALSPTWLLVAAGLLSPHSAQAQSPRSSLIEDATALCVTCIELRVDQSLGAEDGPGYLVPHGGLVQDGAGQFWALQRDGPKVFSASGEYLGTVGRKGSGPREFQDVSSAFVDPTGNVHIFDPTNLRESVFTPARELVEAWRSPGIVVTAVPLDGSSYVGNMLVSTASGVGLPLHIVNDGSNLVISFGDLGARTAAPMRTVGIAFDKSADLIYTVEIQDFDLHVWDRSGSLLRAYRRPAFLGPSTQQRRSNANGRATITGSVMAMRVDGRDRLWVASWVPKPDWRSFANEVPGRGGTVEYGWSAPSDVFTSVLEVIDLEESEVIARVELGARLIYGFLDEGRVFGPVHGENGYYWIDVSTVIYTPGTPGWRQ